MLSLALLMACFPAALSSVAQVPVPSPMSRAVEPQQPPPADLCPLTVYIDAQGHLYDSRFGGRYRVTEQTLRNDVGGGCKQRGQTSSVRIEASPRTKYGRFKDVMDLIKSVRPEVPVTIITPGSRH